MNRVTSKAESQRVLQDFCWCPIAETIAAAHTAPTGATLCSIEPERKGEPVVRVAVASFAVLSVSVLTSCGSSNKSANSTATTSPTTHVSSAETHSPSPTPTPTTTTASPPISPSTTPSAAMLSECKTAQLHIALASQGAALGHRGLLFTLTNSSSSSCELIGYPGFELVSGSQVLTEDPQRGSGYIYQDPGPHRVVLDPGAAASFGVTSADVSPTKSQCPQSDAALVTPPDETHTARVAVVTPGCARTAPKVTAVVSGTSGPPV